MKICMAVSGGLDSVTLLAHAINFGHQVIPVLFQYGSKHNIFEREAFRQVLEHYHLKFQRKEIDLTCLQEHLKSNLMAGGGDIPEGHYEAESMRQTVVPGRNLIFASVLAGIAWSEKCEEVWLGTHSGDHHIYPDCRPEFIEAMDQAIRFGTDQAVKLVAPFGNINKANILKKGIALNVPYSLTRTCYKSQRVACGKCGSCRERLHAFQLNSIPDPIQYEFRDPNPGRKHHV